MLKKIHMPFSAKTGRFLQGILNYSRKLLEYIKIQIIS